MTPSQVPDGLMEEIAKEQSAVTATVAADKFQAIARATLNRYHATKDLPDAR